MKIIVTEFGKFRYNHLPLGMCASGDIFQAKADNLPGDVKGVKSYIVDIIVLINESFYKNREKLSFILGILRDTGLKVNALKRSFGL